MTEQAVRKIIKNLIECRRARHARIEAINDNIDFAIDDNLCKMTFRNSREWFKARERERAWKPHRPMNTRLTHDRFSTYCLSILRRHQG